MPSVEKLYREFKAQGLEVLLIDFREDPDVVRRTVQGRGYAARVLLDQSGHVAGREYGVWGPPTGYFIDRRGNLIGRVAGPRDWDTPAARKFVLALLQRDAKR